VNKQLRIWREEGVVIMDDGYLVLRRPSVLQELVG
jgi:hypothetical protein